jgi:isoleucyl-tRNA synthetase
VEISTDDIEGWLIVTEGSLTVALDISITEELQNEGIARELVNRIQNLRKDIGLEVTDTINLFVEEKPEIKKAVINNFDYICSETLARKFELFEHGNASQSVEVELGEDIVTSIRIEKAD